MKSAKSLSHDALVEVVEKVRDILFLDTRESTLGGLPHVGHFDPDKEWYCGDVCSTIAQLLALYKLVPEHRGDIPDGE